MRTNYHDTAHTACSSRQSGVNRTSIVYIHRYITDPSATVRALGVALERCAVEHTSPVPPSAAGQSSGEQVAGGTAPAIPAGTARRRPRASAGAA